MSARLGLAALLLAGLPLSSAADSLARLAEDGLYRWQIAVTPDAPAWCCLNWRDDTVTAAGCDFDKRYLDFGGPHAGPAGEYMSVYVRVADGRPNLVRALAADCPVKSRQTLVDLDPVPATESIEWLSGYLRDRKLGSSAMAALAVHDEAIAGDRLLAAAAAGQPLEARKQAVFWLAHARLGEAEQFFADWLFKDDDARFREHAAFAVSQSRSTQRAPLLIRQGQTDPSAQVRKQAWFWLAQTGAPEAEAAIRTALRDEPRTSVIQGAVFALSQLPEPRGVDALIETLSDRSLREPARRQAMFWLAQSDDDRATEFLGELFAAE